MPKTCKFNKDRLLELYFQETGGKEEGQIRHHVEQCPECRAYLVDLEQTDRSLRQWSDAAPLPYTLDLILDRISGGQPKPVAAKPSPVVAPIAPFFKILSAIIALLGAIGLLRHQVPLFSFWETVQKWWIVQFLGPVGVAAIFVFIFGVFLTLSLFPVLIWDSQLRK